MNKPAILLCAATLWISIGGEGRAEIERPPPYLHGHAAIPGGEHHILVASRFIAHSSVVLLTVDSSTAPSVGPNAALPGVKVRTHGDGFFEVETLDGSAAPPSGVPFSWVFFNLLDYSGSKIGHAVLPAGASGVTLAGPALTSDSVVLLTVDTSGVTADPPLPEVMVVSRNARQFTVGPIDGGRAPAAVPFNYMVTGTGFRTGVGQIPNDRFAWEFPADVTLADAVMVTIDRSVNAGPFPRAPYQSGVKVSNRHAGQFSVSMRDGLEHRDFGVRFSYAIVKALPQWEEYGPVGLGGLPFAVAVDPHDRRIMYGGSIHGGIWRTLNGGDTWHSIWPTGRALVGVVHIAMDPGAENGQHLAALLDGGVVLQTNDAGVSWTELAAPSGGASAVSGRLAFRHGHLLACNASGLWDHAGATWKIVNPAPGGAAYSCSDVVVGTDGTLYVASLNLGLVRFRRNWKTLKQFTAPVQVEGKPHAAEAVRIALGPKTIMVNVECTLFAADRAALEATPAAPVPETSWHQVGAAGICGSSGTATDLSVAISPTDDQHFIAGGRWASVHARTRAGSYEWISVDRTDPVSRSGMQHYYDFRQAAFVTDQLIVGASDAGVFMSTNGGLTWKEADTRSQTTDGAQLSAYLGLSVSLPDQFRRVMLAGNIQDISAALIVGRTAGIKNGGSEGGLLVLAPTPRSRDAHQQHSTFRAYSTEITGPEGGGDRMIACDFSIPGPDYHSREEEGYFRFSSLLKECHAANPAKLAKSDAITAIAAARDAFDHVLLGTRDGEIHRATDRTDGFKYDYLTKLTSASVSTIYFAGDKTAFVGYANGEIYRIDDPFGAHKLTHLLAPKDPAGGLYSTRVVEFAGRYEDPSELYVAYGDERFTYGTTKDWDLQLQHDPGVGGVFISRDRGASWSDYGGVLATPGLRDNLAKQKMEVVGLVRDPESEYLYVATGHNGNLRPNLTSGWDATSAPSAEIFRSRAGSNLWAPFGAGLPKGLPINALAFGQDNGLFIATYGRGIWWRRDSEVIRNKR